MYKIEVINKNWKTLGKYESDIIPLVGDYYSQLAFDTKEMQVVAERLLFPNAPSNIQVKVFDISEYERRK
jgi:hypothetical protein